MERTCTACKRPLPEEAFCKVNNSLNVICKACDRNRHNERTRAEIERQVRSLYNGRCVLCDTVENLEVVQNPYVVLKRRNPRAMILICSHCRAKGIPTMSKYKRDCLRCGHLWFAKKPETIVCPKCNSPYWNVVKR